MGIPQLRRGRVVLAAAVAGIAAAGALALPGAAGAAPVPAGAAVQPAEAAALAAATGVDRSTASARVAAQRSQAALAGTLGTKLGTTKAAGSYLDPASGALVVNVTDAAAAKTVAAAPAR
jgi:hypothetical protein